MDFSTIDLTANSDHGADCHLEHPVTGVLLYDDNNEPITIRVVGPDSRQFRKAVSAMSERAGKKPAAMTPDVAEERAVELLSSTVVSWKGIEWEGAEFECNPANVRTFLKRFPPIRAQLDAFIADRSNFLTTTGKK